MHPSLKQIVLSGLRPPPGCYNFRRSNTAKFRNVVRTGGILACIGTSITGGTGAGNPQPTDGAQPFSWPAVLADILRARGFNAYQTARWADSNYGSAGSLAYDPRVTIGSANWATSSATFGGQSWLNTADTAGFTFQPSFQTDTATVWYQRNSALATWKCDIGGSQIGSNVNAAGTPNAVVSQGFTTTKGANAWNFSRVSGGGFRIIGMEAYDSTISNQIRVWNCGFGGSQTSSWIDTANATRSGEVAKVLPYDVVIIALERNDCSNAIALATYETNLTTLIGYVRTLGAEVVLAIEPGQSSAVTDESTQSGYSNVVSKVALTLGVPYISQRAWLGGGYIAGYYYDSTHPNATGYSVIASRVADVCSYLKRL